MKWKLSAWAKEKHSLGLDLELKSLAAWISAFFYYQRAQQTEASKQNGSLLAHPKSSLDLPLRPAV